MSRKDVIIIASVSCIYGLGSPKEYSELILNINLGDTIFPKELLFLVFLHFEKFVYSFFHSSDFSKMNFILFLFKECHRLIL